MMYIAPSVSIWLSSVDVISFEIYNLNLISYRRFSSMSRLIKNQIRNSKLLFQNITIIFLNN